MDSKSPRYENEDILVFIEDGIVNVVYKQPKKLEVEVVKLAVQKRLELSGPNVTLPILIDMRINTGGTPGTREYLSTEESMQGLSAGAILIDNIPTMIGYNIYMAFDKPPLPIKAFVNRKKAIAWLNTFRYNLS